MTHSSARYSFWFSNIGHLFTHMFMLLYPTVVLALEKTWGMTYGELLTLALPGFILFGAAALPAGWLGDKWSEGGMLAVMFAGLGFSAILTGLATSPWMIALGLGCIGLFAAIYHPVGISMVVRSSVNRGWALGINGVFGSIGLASAAFVAGALTDLVHWRAAFIVPGVIAVATGAGFGLVVKAGHLGNQKVDRVPQPDVGRKAMVSSFIALACASVFTGIIFNATSVALPKMFAERMQIFGGREIGVGGFVSLVYLLGGLSQLLGGLMADRYQLKRIYMISYLLQVPMLLLAAYTNSLPLLLASIMMVVLQLGVVPVESSLYALYSPSKWRSTSFGVKFVISLGVSSVAVPIVAVIHERTHSFEGLFILLGALALAVVGVALFLPGDRQARSPAQSATNAVPAAQGD
jgi:MFS family permease